MKAHPWTICLKCWKSIACCLLARVATYFVRGRAAGLGQGAGFIVRIVWCAKIVTFKALMFYHVSKVGITCITKINRSIYILPVSNGFLPRKCISFVDFALSSGVCTISSFLAFSVTGNTRTLRSTLPRSTAFTWLFTWWHL